MARLYAKILIVITVISCQVWAEDEHGPLLIAY